MKKNRCFLLGMMVVVVMALVGCDTGGGGGSGTGTGTGTDPFQGTWVYTPTENGVTYSVNFVASQGSWIESQTGEGGLSGEIARGTYTCSGNTATLTIKEIRYMGSYITYAEAKKEGVNTGPETFSFIINGNTATYSGLTFRKQ